MLLRWPNLWPHSIAAAADVVVVAVVVVAIVYLPI